MKVLLDKDNYYTGIYFLIGDVEGEVIVDELPPYEEYDKQLSCKYEDNNWVYDENKYQEIKKQREQEEKNIQIAELEDELNDTDYKIIKSSEYEMAGLEPPYDIQELHQERQRIRDEINKLQK